MISLKRKKATPAVVGHSDAPQTSAASLEMKEMLPGLGVAAAGLLAAVLVLWFGMINDSRQHQIEQMIQAWGGGQASVLQQALNQLSSDTQRAASNPQLLEALNSGDRSQIEAAERSLGYWDWIVDAHINLNGQAVQNTQRAAPMNFAALDLVRRVEGGQIPAPEAYRVGDRWLVYSVAPLRGASNQSAKGTLLLAVDLQRLLKMLPPMPAGIGQLQATQQFGNSPAQVLLSTGEAADSPAKPLPSNNPNWKFSFTPGRQLTETVASPLILILAALLALGGSLLGMRLVLRKARATLDEDADKLQQMLRELAAGKQVKSFSLSLPVLDELAKGLARLPQRRSEPTAQPALSREELLSRTAALDDSALPPTDILDIDILDDDQDLLGLEQTPVNTSGMPVGAKMLAVWPFCSLL